MQIFVNAVFKKIALFSEVRPGCGNQILFLVLIYAMHVPHEVKPKARVIRNIENILYNIL